MCVNKVTILLDFLGSTDRKHLCYWTKIGELLFRNWHAPFPRVKSKSAPDVQYCIHCGTHNAYRHVPPAAGGDTPAGTTTAGSTCIGLKAAHTTHTHTHTSHTE
jgi:hypothetical protein